MDLQDFYSPELIRLESESLEALGLGRRNIKEENNMNIPGKLRDDLKRIYGAADPLNYIEDVRAETNPDTQEEEMIVRLRVPRQCRKYMGEFFINPVTAPPNLERWTIEQAERWDLEWDMACRCRVNEGFVKPARVFFNGDHTTVVWPDGEKTVVGVAPGEKFDEYTGFCAAIVKRLFGSSREAQKFLDKVKVVQKKKEKKKEKDARKVSKK